ncbi:aminotransferase class III-fold pyridoxal phosphate-dependent enzyme [Burkholderia cepacia]|uniref:aminotransferase class III-fold pyridoxal phosphate-dependent enzyme n=1 Tax=Burkholderia cepacia TaxID=292 RepID=UPI001CF4E022|nr:aminotransferase class III-fold pyridoxal phosphate-dependent enzyme [Burkholderia cepacia]MCA8030987.1 aminotransferase class III-fold pyridoxal phosphate-dependent enzyme [Burkholderia cepacia]
MKSLIEPNLAPATEPSRKEALFHPMIDPKEADEQTRLIIERGDGCHVWDSAGMRYLDTVASLWNVNVGHNRREVKEAIVRQLDRLAYYSTFGNTSNPPAIELSNRLIDMFAGIDMSRVLFSSGGSDAVETALKTARQYWRLEGKPQRTKFLSLKWGYHGVHIGGTSINGNPVFSDPYGPLLPDCIKVESPYTYRNKWDEPDPERLAALCVTELDDVIRACGADTVAAFIAEPVQGAGGVIVPHDSYWPGVRRVLDKHGVLLISDEIVTGFGRTGSMSGAQGWGVAPDIMAMAKGINSGYVPLGVTVLNRRVASAWERPGVPAAFMHGYTYSGHPVACAAANANLKIVADERLPENATTVGGYLLGRLQEFDRYGAVGDIRGKGLMACLELVKDRETREMLGAPHPYVKTLINVCRENGAIIRLQGNRLILSPPLVFTTALVDEAIEILHVAFQRAEQEAPLANR